MYNNQACPQMLTFPFPDIFSQITNQGEFSQGTHFPLAVITLAVTTGV